MAGISGQGTTYNLPNYVGELFGTSVEDTPLLSAIGGLTGGESVESTMFNWQTYDLRDPEDDRQRKEGADAPDASERARSAAYNVLEIHQEKVEVSYTKQAAFKQVNTDDDIMRLGSQPVQDELTWQIDQQLKQIARDVEKTFIVGERKLPSDNDSARRTRGLLEAIETNTVEAGGSLTEDDVLDLMQEVWENGGIQESDTRTLIVGASRKRDLTNLFINDRGFQERERNVGGVNLQTIETDFGRCNVMLDRWMPKDTVVVASLEELSPAFLEIPGKGHFFAEPLAKTGSAEKVQLYGEIGLKYGNELKHGKITGVESGES